MSQTQMKSNINIALEQCIRDFSFYIDKSTLIDRPIICLKIAEKCLQTYLICMDAYESDNITKEQKMHDCKAMCEVYLNNCIIEEDPISLLCSVACKRFLIECGNSLSSDL